jgi:integrase
MGMQSKRRLTGLRVEKERKAGLYPDGDGLYLQVTTGADDAPRKSWLFRFRLHGRRERRMGLGAYPGVSLQEARDSASAAYKLCRAGIDPIEARRLDRTAAAVAEAKSMSFDECAKRYIASHSAGWRNIKHAQQWPSSLAAYVSPVFGKLPVQEIDTALVMKALDPIWPSKPETASRVRGRIEAILDWAKANDYRSGENPARWRGHLDKLLPKRSKVRKVKHHAALPYGEIGGFMLALRERETTAAQALEFTILTAARTGETIGAQWPEIDPAGKVWTVPAERIKGGREHRVPLSDAALSIVKKMSAIRQNDFIFPGARSATLSDMAFRRVLQRMDRDDLTAHGFRSTFRTWAAEVTSFPREVVEAALAHVVGDKVEAAYQRGDMFEKRRKLMDAWAAYCARPAQTGTVIDLKSKASV